MTDASPHPLPPRRRRRRHPPALAGPASVAAAGLLLALAMVAGCANDAVVTGTVTYREKIALPADAVVEVVLQDVSRADAPARELGRVRLTDAGQPPLDFAIAYDPAAIDSAHTYAVRARITVGDELRFVTDRRHPVLTRGHGRHVDLVLAMTRGTAPAATAGEPRAMRGMVVLDGDGATFTDCNERRPYPLAREGDFVALERALLASRHPAGHGLLATFAGRLVRRDAPDGGRRLAVVVDRFQGVWPGETCGNPGAVATLQDSYWKLTRLDGQPVHVAPQQREPHLVLHRQRRRLAGSGGCNRLMGTYHLHGDTLRVVDLATTRQVCPAGMAQEQRLLAALAAVVTWEIAGVHLELRDATGQTRLRLEERPLP